MAFPKLFKNNSFNIEFFLRKSFFETKGKILDLGAGVKPYEHLFKPEQYESCDPYLGGGHTYSSDAEKVPVPDGYFSGVFSTNLYEHLKHPWLVTRESNRILKMGGRLVISVPQSEEIHGDPVISYFQYTKHGLTSLLEENGFSVLKFRQRSKWFSFLAEQFRKACRYNPHIGIFLFPLSEVVFPFFGNILDIFDKKEVQGEGWCVLAVKVREIDL